MSKHRHKKAHGGRTEMKVSGNPDVFEEAEDKHGTLKKHGGKVKRHRATGGKVVGLMTGGAVRPRLDRPGRKRGGGVGADTSPLSTAHAAHGGGKGKGEAVGASGKLTGGGGADGSSDPRDTYGGTPAD